MKLVISIIFLLSGIIVASESEPIRAAVQTGREAEAKAINETDTDAKTLTADFLLPSPDLLRREAVDTSSCKDLIPGMKHFQRGVDGARLDLISLDQGEDDGYRNLLHLQRRQRLAKLAKKSTTSRTKSGTSRRLTPVFLQT